MSHFRLPNFPNRALSKSQVEKWKEERNRNAINSSTHRFNQFNASIHQFNASTHQFTNSINSTHQFTNSSIQSIHQFNSSIQSIHQFNSSIQSIHFRYFIFRLSSYFPFSSFICSIILATSGSESLLALSD